MTTPTASSFDFDVALSFAGEDRTYVQQVAGLLRDRGVKVFYDEYMATELWGDDLYVVLDEVYRKRARFTVAFVSHHYASKPWTRHERQSAQARALNEAHPYFLPVRLDDSELPGLRPTTGYVDARRTTVEQLIEMIEQKVKTAPGVTKPTMPVLRVPRTADQQREFLARRPDGWEYMLYAGVLWQRRQALEPKWRDHELGYAPRTGQHLDDREAVRFLENTLSDITSHADTVTKIFDARFVDAAFGPPGTPGDPGRIEHLATRLVGIYEELMGNAAAIRGMGVSPALRDVMEFAARLTDRPLQEIREFIELVVEKTDQLPELLAADEPGPVEIEFKLVLTIDDDAMRAHEEAVNRARKRLL